MTTKTFKFLIDQILMGLVAAILAVLVVMWPMVGSFVLILVVVLVVGKMKDIYIHRPSSDAVCEQRPVGVGEAPEQSRSVDYSDPLSCAENGVHYSSRSHYRH
jgi:uncharacterized membrane protein